MTNRLGLALLAAALGCSKSDGAPPPPGAAGPAPAVVALGPVRGGALQDGWTYLGRVEAALAAELSAAVEGHVVEVRAREGDRVTKGQVIVRLDAARVKAGLDAGRARLRGLRAQLAAAERQLERAKGLDFPTISEPELDRFRLEVESLAAQVDTQAADNRRLEVELADHVIRAPFAGAVSSRSIDPGAWVARGQGVVELVALDELEVHVDVALELGRRLAVGATASLLGPSRAPATIAGLVPALDGATRTMRARLVADDRPPWLIAGMPVEVEFPVSIEDADAVLVSRDALVRGPVTVRVIKAVDGQAVPIEVEVLATAEADALIKGEGLRAGDEVVIRGNERLRPGQPLSVQP